MILLPCINANSPHITSRIFLFWVLKLNCFSHFSTKTSSSQNPTLKLPLLCKTVFYGVRTESSTTAFNASSAQICPLCPQIPAGTVWLMPDSVLRTCRNMLPKTQKRWRNPQKIFTPYGRKVACLRPHLHITSSKYCVIPIRFSLPSCSASMT